MINKNKKRQPKALMRILSFIISLSLIVTNPYSYDLFEVFGVESFQVVYAEEGENAVEGEVVNDSEGEAANNGEEGDAVNDEGVEGANGEEGEAVNTEEDEVANAEEDEVTNAEEDEVANAEEDEVANAEEDEAVNTEEDEVVNAGEDEVANGEEDEVVNAEGHEEPLKGVRSPSTYTITTISELVDYSKNYDSTHANDIVNITISSTDDPDKLAYQTTATMYQFNEYVSIGANEASAFAGTMNITIDLSSYFNFDKPMFNYIKDSAVITVTGGSNDGYLELRRTATEALLPMFAEHVIHDTEYSPANEGEYTNWKIRLNYYNEENEANARVDFPGVIGSIGDNCKLKLDIINNTKKFAANEVEQDLIANVLATAPGQNAGLICGTLGQNACVMVSLGGTNTDFSVTSASGNAGALIGEMKAGSRLSLSGNNITGGSNRTIKATSGYAGGLVGKMTDAEIVYAGTFTITECIEGALGAGGIAGYYKGDSTNSFGLNNASIDCKVTSASAGGVFGVFETTGNFTFDETGHTNSIASSPNGQANASFYGGLVGTYKTNSLANVLTIGAITVITKGGGGKCAGLIGKLDDGTASYVVVNGATVKNSIGSGFYGIVNNAGNAGHFLNVVGFTLTGSEYSGAGLVGTIGAGVIRLSGTTTLSAKSKQAQLVNERGNTLIYALGNGSDSGWTFNRCTAVSSDDIGNWGEVLRINSANEYIVTGDTDTTSGSDGHILTYDASAHTVTLMGPNTSGNTTTIATTNDFVRAALNMQINQGDKGALQFSDDTNNATKLLGSSSVISITASISLAGTGIMGLMRDDGQQNSNHAVSATDAAFAGTLNGGGTVTLATGEPYGKRNETTLTMYGPGNGTLHHHAKVGLLSVANGATISNVSIAGKIYAESTLNGMNMGGFVGVSHGNLTMSGISETIELVASSSDDNCGYFGGVIGRVDGDGSNVSISGTNQSIVSVQSFASANTSNAKNSICASNGIGYVDDNTVTISFSNYVLGNTSSGATTPAASLENISGGNDAKSGGLIGYINGTSKLKTVNLNDVSISHYGLNLSASNSVGGVLGFEWNKAEVNFGATGATGVVVSNCAVTQASSKAAGLVCNATLHWAVSKLKICNTTFTLNNVQSFGVLVNDGKELFMELKTQSGNGYGFDLSTGVSITDSNSALTVYDELVAYSASVDGNGNSNVLKEGNGVVSIHTASGTVVGGKYEKQITPPNTTLYNNPFTRYYYDLDIIRTAVTSNTYPEGFTAAQQNAYKLMMWSLNQYATGILRGYFTTSIGSTISGAYDLSNVSWYPLNRSEAITLEDASFTFNNKEIEDSSVAGTMYRSTMNGNSQHYLMHSGLFYDAEGNITISGNLTLAGTIGRHETGSGALVAGKLGGLTTGTTELKNTASKKITLDGLRVNSSNTYKPVLINTIGNHVALTLNGVETKENSYADGSNVKMAGSSLIGVVGTKNGEGAATSDSISLTFNDIRLDARTDANKESLSALTSAYGTTQGVFTSATLLQEFIFNNNTECKGVYNYKLTEDWNKTTGDALHHVTYGYEIDGSVEFEGLQNQYVDLLGKTNPVSYANTQGSTGYDFSAFLPYVAVREYDESDATKRSRELMVNHTNVGIDQGCGTYDDPYIIDKDGQIEAIAKILELGTVSDGFIINVPSCTKNNGVFSYNGWCENENHNLTHVQLIFNGSVYKAGDSTKNHTKQDLAKYLAGAYYKITKVTTTSEGEGGEEQTTYSSITISEAAFNGLGGNSEEYVFRGVIVGDSDTTTYPLVNTTGAPLIKSSYGSVVRNLKIQVNNSNITRSQDNNTQQYILSGGCSNYGAVIGQILGGDNIIHGVTVDYSNATIKLSGKFAKIIPVGGYVGVVVSGALIFRGMSGWGTTGLTTGVVKTGSTNIAMDSTDWLYVNPIVGRVLNGYAVYEADANGESNDYKYGETTVTMKNGTKNYSIADIDPDLAKLAVSAYTQIGSTNYYSTNVTVPNAQAMYVLSLLTQSDSIGNDKYTASTLAMAISDSYGQYKMMRHGSYAYVGTTTRTDYDNYVQYDCDNVGTVSGIKWIPYLVEKYTAPVENKYYVISLTNDKTVCNMTLSQSESTWYLPDGFKGIGYLGYNKDSYKNRVVNLRKFDGGGKTIQLNMSLKHYQTSVDNYFPCSTSLQTYTGFGLFNILRHNWKDQDTQITDTKLETDDYKIKNLNLTGTVDYNVVDVTSYTANNVYNTKYVDAGGFAGYCGLEGKNELRIEDIDLSGLTVNGFKTAGGLFGYLKMAASADYLAMISKITATNSTLTVMSKDYVGGIVGRCEQIGLTIDDLSLDKLSIVTYFNDTSDLTYNNGAGGIVGWAQNLSSNRPITLSNITIGSSTATTNLRIGYPNEAPYTNTNNADNYYQIASGGLIGRSMTNKNSSYLYSLVIEHCNVYNVNLYGHRVGGIIGHDAAGTGKTTSGTYLLMSDVHVISTNNASINGIKKLSNLKDRGCGGMIGVMWNDKNKDFIDCSIEGYTLRSFNDTGGISSNMQTGGTITIKNFKASNLKIYSNYHGALFGYHKCSNTYGYNLLFDNIEFNNYIDEEGVIHKYNNGYIDAKYGYLIGNNGSPIKLVGVTRLHLENTASDHWNRIAGSSKNYNYGSGGYIIWADTLGKCTETSTAGTKQSNLTDKTTVEAALPWVTVSPSINISGTGATTTQVLTGDSIMADYAAADTLSNYNNADTNGIISSLADITSAARTTYISFRNSELFSTYKTEMGDESLPEGVSDFAVIAVDNNGNLNSVINSYVQMLTHTPYLYATENNNSVYKISIYRCTYDASNNCFTRTSGSSGLTRDTSGFVPNVNNPDTDADTACFTLVDIQFLNPANADEVWYHVYVPVLIKKMVKFKFKASSMPGTVYDYKNYVYKSSTSTIEDKWGTPSVTNLGTPVTVFFRYEYTSTIEDWQTMIDNGENLMWHSNKKLLLKTAAQNLPSTARMVLVDANENGKAYYAKVSDTGVFTRNVSSSQNDYYLDLTKFKDGSDNFFAPENYGERLPVTASTSSHDGAKAYVIAAEGETVYVKAKLNGVTKGFRPAGDGDASATKYYLTVDGTAGNAPEGISESYYLTIYTDSGNDALRVISVNSASSLSSAPQTGEGLSRHNLRCVTQTESALILGNIYKQTFTTFETENAQNGLVDNGCNYIESDITVEIIVNNDNNEAGTIIRYLDNSSIKLYHSIVLMLTKNDGTSTEKNIYGTPTYSVNTAKAQAGVYGSISSKLTNSTTNVSGFSIDTPQKVSNFIQICDSDFDIKPLLIETRTNPETGPGVPDVLYGGAIITISGLRTHFDFQNIQNQFPYRPNENSTIGTTVTAYSMLDSDATNVAYSNIREEATDENGVRYHGEQPEVATLVYAVDTSSEVELIQNLNLLGINPIDDPDYLTNTIIADGTYSAVSFVDSASAQKIRWTLSLEKKNENGIYEAVNMSDYVSGEVLVGNRSAGAKFTVSGNGYIYDEDYTSAMDITTLTTVYVMKTGTDLEALGGETPVAGVYTNYKVILTATLYTGTGPLTGDISDRLVEGSQKHDYIVYTNAKVMPSWVKSAH